MLVGIEIRESSALAVAVDENGGVRAREVRDGAGADAATAALKGVLKSGGTPTALGLTVRDPVGADAQRLAAAVAAAANGSLPPVVTPGAATALAEHWCGAARGANDVVALTAADGVHAGIVIGGKLFGGAHGLAGAAGWLALNPVEREDYRKLGCLEAEIGAPGIVRRLVWRIKAGDHSRVLDMAGGNMNAITAQQVFDAARLNDGVAISVVRDTAKYIGMAIANLIAVVDPNIVVLGGAIAEAGDLLIEPARAEMLRRVSAAAAQQVAVVPAALGDASAAVGAARAAALARP